MYTPQQIQEIAFAKAVFGGYDVHAVDAVMEPLTNDYIALYNENNHLKNKLSRWRGGAQSGGISHVF